VTDVDLGFHGDAELAPALIDCATSIRLPAPPAWLRARLEAALDGLGAYPQTEAARAALARRHGRPPEEVLLTAGAAEAFVLLARAFTPRSPVCLHPSFTAPEAALRAASHRVERVLLDSPFLLDPALVPAGADLVVLGNPTNPTSVLHPPEVVAALARRGRLLVVDEAFADCVPGEHASLAARRDLPGLIVVRSLTKTWGLAGLRVGYALAEAPVVGRLAAAQPPWPVSALAAVAAEACSSAQALAEADAWAHELARERERLAAGLATVPGVEVVPGAAASFLLLRMAGGQALRERLRSRGLVVRRGDTFPGLGPDWIRVAVRDRETNERLLSAVRRASRASSSSARATAPSSATSTPGMKRIALIADVHGNAVALEAVLDDLAGRRITELVCLGDVAAGGPQPREALARLRELGCPVVLGNADEWLLEGLPREGEHEEQGEGDRLAAIVEWARAGLSPADRDFLRSFGPAIELESTIILCFHGSPRSVSERILAETPQAQLETMLAGRPASIYAGGHTHLQLLRRLGEALYLNPGSVGLPLATGDPSLSHPRVADYALVEIDESTASVELRRVTVDAKAVEQAALGSGMPYPAEWAALLGRRIIRRNAEAIDAAPRQRPTRR
jgi:histidinol-phosphate aminotransferase